MESPARRRRRGASPLERENEAEPVVAPNATQLRSAAGPAERRPWCATDQPGSSTCQPQISHALDVCLGEVSPAAPEANPRAHEAERVLLGVVAASSCSFFCMQILRWKPQPGTNTCQPTRDRAARSTA